MAKIADGVLHKFTTGEKVDADQAPSGGALNPIFEIIREAVNNTDGRVDQLVQALVGVDANRGVFQTKVEVFTATEGQTAFTLTKGTYTVGGDRLQVYVGTAIQTVEGGNFTETSSTVFTLSEGIPAGTSVIAVWVEGLLISAEVAVHGSRHEAGGADELDVLKLKNGDQIGILSTKISRMALDPDDFSGANDYEKVQAAFDQSTILKCGVRFERMFDITGHTINLNKVEGETLYIMGRNRGGIIKNDAGYVFTTDKYNVRKVFIDNVYFISVAGAGMCVWDCRGISDGTYLRPRFIGIRSQHCSYSQVDGIVYSDTYIQDSRWTDELNFGGSGYAFKFSGAYDCSIENFQFDIRTGETGSGGAIWQTGSYVNQVGQSFNYTAGLRIRDCIFQSLDLKAIYLTNVAQKTVIDGNYFEDIAQGNIFFDTNGDASGLTISNNTHNGTQSRALSYSLITWPSKVTKSVSIGNIAYAIGIHDGGHITTGKVTSICDLITGTGVDISMYNITRVDEQSYSERYVSTTQSIPNNTATEISFTTRTFNSTNDKVYDISHSILSGGRIQITKPGIYQISVGSLVWDNASSVGHRNLSIANALLDCRNAVSDTLTVVSASQTVPVITASIASPYVLSIQGLQNSGGALNVQSCTVTVKKL